MQVMMCSVEDLLDNLTMIRWFKRCVLLQPLKICDDGGKYSNIDKFAYLENLGEIWIKMEIIEFDLNS